WIGLAIVVAQVAFKVAHQLGDTPVEESLPAIRESAIQLELKCLVIPDGLRESIWLSVWRIDLFVSGRIDARLRKADALAGAAVEVQTTRAAGRDRSTGRVNKRHQINSGIEFRADVTNKVHLAHTRK